MSLRPSVALPQVDQHQVSVGTSREREFYNATTPANEIVARSSPDPALTAFAQLGALRLDAQRVIISLFGRQAQHVLTEATRTLSLQDDVHHNLRDELWIGRCTLSYSRSFCKVVMNPPKDVPKASDRIFVSTDLLRDDTFKDHSDVTSLPNIRFLASSPIISPKGIVIGAYTILDNKPRDPLDTDILEFLVDISTTVMDYLDTSRSKAQKHRGERMMVGIGSFLEGKGSLRNSWLTETEVAQSPIEENSNHEGRVNQKQQDKQISEDVAKSMAPNGTPNQLPFRPGNLHLPGKFGSQKHGQQGKIDSKAQTKPNNAPQATSTVNDQPTKQPLRDSLSSQLGEVFSRGANIIRESIEVEAVVFFDASFRSQMAPEQNNSDSETSTIEGLSSGDEEALSREAARRREDLIAEQADDGGKDTLDPCKIIAFATSSASSVNDQLADDNRIVLSESFLGGLLHRYPRGKIFNYGQDGALSSDDTSDGVFKKFLRRPRGRKYKRTQRSVLRQDAETLLRLAPDSRSIIFSPQWDSHKGRWYSGSLTWTKAKHRVFTSDDELAFVLTFGHSLMAEVHRLNAQFTDRAKGDLLAGLSHELRSPLHGIFGTAELLNDTVMDALQRGFVHTISSCAFTLLGSINQLLEYASINDVQPNSATTPYGSGNTEQSSPSKDNRPGVRSRSKSGNVDIESYVELDAAVEDAIETVFAGYAFFNSTRSPLRGVAGLADLGGRPFDSQGGVKVIFDIDRSQSWKFSTRPGAWHVILTNIFGNALKFTQRGHILVSLKSTPTRFDKDGAAKRSKVTITIKDTGCGIDPEYMKSGLFTAFEQEDRMSIGNGLGLNITHRIVSSLGGDIRVNSEKDVGTEVVITVILDHMSELNTPEGEISQSPVPPVRALVHGKTVGLLGLGNTTLDMALSASLGKLCHDWLKMDVCLVIPTQTRFAHCDFYISLHEYLDMGNMEIKSIAPGESEHFSSPVIIICSSPRIVHSMFAAARKRGDEEVLEFISQPCGPRKLAKALDVCMKRQQQRLDLARGRLEEDDIPSQSGNKDNSEERKRYSLLNVPELGVGEKLKAELTHNRPSISNHGPRNSSERSRSRQDLDNSRNPVNASAAPPEDQSSENQPHLQTEAGLIPPMSVLLVDDNDINLKLLVAFMKKMKHHFLLAHNGEEALEAFKANSSSIKIILMGKFKFQSTSIFTTRYLTFSIDISMPVMDGLESTRRIRKFEKTLKSQGRVTIVALTGVAQADTQRDAIRSGMDLFLTKPVRLDGLAPIIQDAISTTQPTGYSEKS
ncbi:hypothetical protein N7481_003484 [Penicillium waksmanii]|uniref:uncharacterized protein n=1 Tax=Penicillium waksmanii TaxID=69791 RepID=UPI002548D8B7|nr:uncharacterized protein N7481_003484 [Penicillium waksmanii]KAJ5988274.1 hypothetical protein N7481_003484 [Penicillium waksmanii]